MVLPFGLLVAAIAAGQSLPMSPSVAESYREALARDTYAIRFLRTLPVVREHLDTFSTSWEVVCDVDRLTGESSDCRLESPDYMPAGWEFSVHCRRGSDCFRDWGLKTISLSLRLSVHCNGAIKKPKLLPLVMRFIVGDEVIEVPESPEVLFRSPDGSWADKMLAFEEVGQEHVWRFDPDTAAVREFLTGPHCAGAEQ